MGELSWSQAGTGAIQMDDAGNVWNSGHVNALLPMSSGLLVAADTGGLWSATESGPVVPLTDWEAPDLTSLARGPDGEEHIFVGGGLGISFSAPEVVVTSPDQLHAFAVGQDHVLWHYTRDAGVWSTPESLGPDVVGPPAVCSWGGGRIDVFVIGTDGRLWHKWRVGGVWGPSQDGYESLGGACSGQPSAVAWAANRLDVFVVGRDGTLNHKWWDGTSWRPSPDGLESLGGSLLPSPVAISTVAGSVDVFCVQRGDHMLLHKRYDGAWLPPTDYEQLGPVANVPAATSWGSNTIQLCAVQPDGSLGYKSWDGANWAPSPTDWTPLGALPDPFITAPSVGSWGSDRLDVVCVDATGTLQHKWLDGTSWGPSDSGWEAMGQWVAGHPNLVAPGSGRLDIVINGDDGALYWKSFTGAGWVPWAGGWLALPRPVIGALHESDVNATLPLLSWREIATPHEAGRVAAILVLPAIRRIVLGCDDGLWWSPIPASSAHGGGYAWSRVDSAVPPGCGFYGLAATGDDTFVAAAYGSNVGSGAYGLFRGVFTSPGLTMQRSNIVGADPRLMGRTSVASCDNARNQVYAVACDVWTDHVYTETPEAVCWGPDRIDLFARGGSSDCQHLWWDGSSWSWESLAGVMLGTPRAVSWAPGRLDLFCIGTDRALYHKWWDGAAWGPSLTGWERRGGVCVSDPAVCSWASDRLDVFVVGLDGALYHQWWDGAGWGPAGTDFENLGGALCGQPVAVAPAVNRIDVYAIGHDGKLQLCRYDGAGWVGWQSLGDDQVFYPTAVVSSGGAVDVFCTGAATNVLHKRWDGTAWHPSPTTFDDLNGMSWDGPSAIADGSTIEVYGRGQDNNIYVNTLPPGGTWSGWNGLGGNSLGDPATALASGPKAVSWGPGRRDVFVKVPPAEGNPRVWQLWSEGDAAPSWADLGGNLRPAVAPYSIYTFLRSGDGGANFVSGAMYLPDAPHHYMMDIAGGNQGFYNNCVTVSPADADTVVVGWRGGPYLSRDAGDTWRRIDDGDSVGNCHGDVHAVLFDPTGTDLYSGSDGGVAVTSDLGSTWRSGHNRLLHTLQVYGGGIVAFSSSYQVDGLVVAGLQDNGNITCRLGSGEPWRQFIASDGGITVCLRTGQILYTNNMDPRVSVFRYGGSGVKVPLTVPKPGGSPSADGLACSPHIVNEPTYTNAAGQWMVAVASDGTDLYGGFADGDGGNLHWEYLGAIVVTNGAAINCANSSDGHVILAGFSDGRIAAFDTATAGSTFQTIYPGKDGRGSVVRVLMHDVGYAYAIANRGPNGIVLRYQDGVWERVAHNLPLERFWGLTTDWLADPKTMFVTTDSRVYTSTDRGESWQIMTQGLPRRAHLNEIDFVEESTGARFIHAATWGRSIFRSPVT
jgi:Repeat of unknown function (DUF346)